MPSLLSGSTLLSINHEENPLPLLVPPGINHKDGCSSLLFPPSINRKIEILERT